MITKQQIETWLDEGFDILQNNKPVKVNGDIWEYINKLDTKENNIFILRELVNWEAEEIAKI